MQRKVMQLLDQFGASTVPDIGSRFGVSRQSMQVICNDLLSRGWIQFADNPRHKRSKLATLTAAGSQIYLQAQEMEYRTIEQVLPEIEFEEPVKVREILACIRKVLDRISSDP
jgi:DNA-binding MarR family transcriptional regulator